MTNEQILENNKLIAEFMELKQVKWPDEKELFWVNNNFIEDFTYFDDYSDDSKFDWGNSLPQTNKLIYNYSWDWLMPVVEKILKTIGVKCLDECDDKEWYVITGVTRLTLGCPINFVFNRVVQYIKWYNENK